MSEQSDRSEGFASGASEELYRTLAETTHDFVFVMDRELRFEYVNSATAAVIGKEQDEIVGQTLDSLLPSEQAKYSLQHVRKTFESGEPDVSEMNVPMPALDRRIWLNTSLTPIFGEGGEVVSVMGVAHDITHQKEIELALAESERRYRMLAEAAQDFIFIVDTGGAITYVNEHGAKMFGRSPDEMIGRKMADLFPPEIAEGQIKSVSSVIQSDMPLYTESLVAMPMGELWLGTLLSPVKDDEGAVTSVLGIARNITAKKQLERELVSERDFTDKAINSMPGIFYLFDSEGRMLRWNRFFEQVTGYTSDEIAAMGPTDFFTGRDVEIIAERVNEVFLKGEANAEADLVSKDGVRTRFYFTGYRMEADGGPYLVGVGTDISALRRAEVELLESDERLRMALEGTGDSIWEWDYRSGRIEFDDGWQKRLGYEHGEQCFDTDWWNAHVHPDSIPGFEKAMRDYLEGRKPAFEFEYRVRGRDGEWIWVWAIGKCVEWDEKREPLRLIGTLRDITNRKLLEASVVSERDRAQQYLDITPAIIVVLNGDGTVRVINQRGCEILEYEADEITGRDWFEYFLPVEIRDEVKGVFNNLISGEMELAEYHENEVLTRSGKKRIVAWHNKILHGEDGAVEGILSSGEDITERRAAEEMLRESEKRFKVMFDNSISGILLAEIESRRFVLANDTICEMLGFTHDELARMSVNDIHPKESLPHVTEQFERMGRGELRVVRDLPVKRKDGSVFYADISSSLVALSGATYLMGHFSDSTDRYLAERALIESEEKYRSLFEESNDVIFISSPEGRLLDINPAGVKLFGYGSREEIAEADIGEDLFVDTDDRRRYQERIERYGEVRDYEMRLRRKSGEELIVSVSANVIRDDTGAAEAYRGIMRDVTEQRRLESQLIQAQKMESIGNLAGGVAHDFNNYLTAIQGYADLALMEQPEGGILREYLAEIRNSSARAADLTRQLLLFGRREEVNLQPLDLADVLTGLQKMLSRLIGERYVLTTTIGGNLDAMMADKGLIEQVIVNLVVNSRDAMPEGGEIQIEAFNEAEPVGDQVAGQRAEGKYVHLKISDNGDGMDDATLSHIFEPFFTTKEVGKGTGLGLSVVYGIVAQHGGFIEVDSEIGKGTVFDVFIPVAEEEAARQALAQESGITSGSGRRVLLVEDDEAVKNLASQMLSDSGFNVTTATNAVEAEELFGSASDEFDIVFSDVILPDENGLELALRLKERNPEVRIVLASGYTGEYLDRAQIEEHGFLFLQKPYTLAQLVEKVGGASQK